MHAIRYIETVGEDRILKLTVKKPAGTRLEVIVLDLDENGEKKHLEISRLQEMTGFAKNVLGSPEEDIWNDL